MKIDTAFDFTGGPRVERILFNDDNDDILREYTDMSLLIRSKGNNPFKETDRLVFQPFKEPPGSSGSKGRRRIFQLSALKRPNYGVSEEDFDTSFKQSYIKDVKLRLNFDNTPQKMFKGGMISNHDSGSKNNGNTCWSMGKASGEAFEGLGFSGSKNNSFNIVAPSPLRRRPQQAEGDLVSKRFKLGQFNFQSFRQDTDGINLVSLSASFAVLNFAGYFQFPFADNSEKFHQKKWRSKLIAKNSVFSVFLTFFNFLLQFKILDF